MEKERSEMTKVEIYREIRFNNKALAKMGRDADSSDWINFYAYYDSNVLLVRELKSRNYLSINDRYIIEAANNLGWAARKRIEKVLKE